MIPLQLRSNVAGREDRFVVRLNASAEPVTRRALSPSGGIDAYLDFKGKDGAIYGFDDGSIEILGSHGPELDGDVLLVDPVSRIAQRLIRARSPHNTFLITEQCDQLCIMCSQPPKKGHEDSFPLLSAAVELAPPEIMIGLSGGEPTLHKQNLFDFLRRAHQSRPDIRFHVLTNAQHFETEDLGFLRESASWGVIWGVPLYAATAKVHDAIVKKAGAFDRLLSSFAILLKAGAAVELRTVVMKQTAPDLPRLSHFVATHLGDVANWAIMQLENAGYARAAWAKLFFDSSIDFRPIAEAIDVAAVRGVVVTLYNFPLCTIPAVYRGFAAQSISDWKQKYLGDCAGCSAKAACGGFFEWYEADKGFQGVGAL